MCNMFPSTFTQGFFSHFAETIFFHLEFRTKMNVNELNDKWTLQEWWTQHELFVYAQWAHGERFVNGEREQSGAEIANDRTVTVLWAHCERTVNALWAHGDRKVNAL